MKFKKRESLFVILLIIMYIMVGFFRDAVFMNINSQLYKLYFDNYVFDLPNWLSIFSDWPYMRLYYFKYVLTALFVALYFCLSLLAVWQFTHKKSNFRWVIYAHLIVLAASVLTYVSGMALDNFPKGYLFTRNLMGLLQSPFITMIIIPALKLEEKSSIE